MRAALAAVDASPAHSVILAPPPKAHVPFTLVAAGADGFAVHYGVQPLIVFSLPGMRATLGDGALGQFSAADLLRWSAPFALAQRGVILLHAACVAREGLALAMMAPGGTGKSTLAGALQRRGWQSVADDALYCGLDGHVDVRAEPLLRAWCRENAPSFAQTGMVDFEPLAVALETLASPALDGEELAEARSGYSTAFACSMAQPKLGGIAFLALPRNADATFTWHMLTPVTAFHYLVQHGFGAAPTSAAWRNEAEAYQALAGRVPSWSLRVPEGSDALAATVPVAAAQWLAWMQALPSVQRA